MSSDVAGDAAARETGRGISRKERVTHFLSLGANLGALVGVFLLVIEMRQTRDLTRAQSRHEMASETVELLQQPASDRQLSNLLYLVQPGAQLSPEDEFQFELRTNALVQYWEDAHY